MTESNSYFTQECQKSPITFKRFILIADRDTCTITSPSFLFDKTVIFTFSRHFVFDVVVAYNRTYTYIVSMYNTLRMVAVYHF